MTTDEKLDAILTMLRAIDARLTTATSASAKPAAGSAGRVATDRELSDARGNPEVRKDPKDWTGGSYVGSQYSDCPPEYLEQLAGLLEWMARKDDEAGARGEKDAKGYAKSGKWKWNDAALARGWARRNAAAGGGAAPSTDEIPF